MLYAKMLKETETEQTIGFVVIIFCTGCISIRGPGPHDPSPPPGNAYAPNINIWLLNWIWLPSLLRE